MSKSKLSSKDWWESDEFLDRWVGHRAKNTKKLYKKAWKRWLSFLEVKERWNPIPEELVIDYERDLKVPIREGGGETGRRIERFYKWLTTEYINPIVKSDIVAIKLNMLLTYFPNIQGKWPKVGGNFLTVTSIFTSLLDFLNKCFKISTVVLILETFILDTKISNVL